MTSTGSASVPALILLVDGAEGSLLFSESVLHRKHHTVEVVHSGAEALLRVRRDQPRLVVFGYQLGDMTAPELCRLIRDDPAARGTSLLFVAEHAEEGEVDLCMSAGCNDIIFRPVKANDLDEKVHRLTAIPARRELRTLTKIEVSVENRGYYVLGHSHNISSSGMLVEADHVFPPDAKVRLHFYLSGEVAPIRAESKVVRAQFAGGMPRYGMEFVNLTVEDRERINRYVHRLRARELH
jgi:CheY-like chemotaxis protein